MTIPNNADFSSPSGFTVCGWVKVTTSSGSDQQIVNKENSYEFAAIGGFNKFQGAVETTGIPSWYWTGTQSVTFGVWKHFVFCYGSAAGSNMRIYINGVLVTNEAITGTVEPSTYPLYFGTRGSSVGSYELQGYLDEVACFDRALTAAEVASLWSTAEYQTFYRDADGDGYGTSETIQAFERPSGYALISGDCLDINATVYPGAPELPDGLDNNCNGTIDEGLPGSRDYAFSSDGIQTTSFTTTSQARGVVVQADGKMVAVGYAMNAAGTKTDFAAVRYDTDGTVDTSYGTAGKTTVDFGFASFGDKAMCGAIQSDGKVLMAGQADNGTNLDFGIARLNTNGTLDTTFNTTGKVTLNWNIGGTKHDRVTQLLVQPDGQIVCVGYAFGSASGTVIAIARYNANGTLDTSFDSDGKLTTTIAAVDDGASSAVLQPDGKIVVRGGYKNGTTYDLCLLRYLPNGALDPTFGTSGKVLMPIGAGNEDIMALALQPDGKIVAAAEYTTGSSDFDWLLLRFNADGSNDNTFDGDGRKSYTFGSGNDLPRSVIVLPDGKIAAVGQTNNGTNDDMAILRVNADGSADTSFDGDGKLTLAPGPGSDLFFSVALDSQNNLVAAGLSDLPANVGQFAVVRVLSQALPGVWSLAAVQGTGGTNLGITGQIDPANLSTTVSLEYGTTNALGSTQSIGTFTGNTLQNFSATLYPGGLTLGTTYYYRIVATNANGTTTTATQTLVYAPGALDFTFSVDGIQTTPIGTGEDNAYAVAVQADGKIVVAGESHNGSNNDFAVARYLADGTPDTSFDTDGKVTTPVGTGEDSAYAVAVQSDGKIIAAGFSRSTTTGNEFALVRYNADGSLDSSFGTGGKATLGFNLGGSNHDDILGIAIQPDGKIVCAGYANTASGFHNVAIARFHGLASTGTPGQPDASFGIAANGKFSFAVGSAWSYAMSVALQSDGKIVVSGTAGSGTAYDFMLARIHGLAATGTPGTLDTSFDTDGKVTTSTGTVDDARSVSIQPDGKIVAGGTSSNGSNNDVAVVRYLTTGATDPTFGTSGIVKTNVQVDDSGFAVALQRDGRIVVGGSSNNPTADILALRYNADGSLDTSFDGDGKRLIPINTSADDVAYGIALQPDGNIVLAGSTVTVGGTNDFAVARVLAFPETTLIKNGSFESVESFGGNSVTGFNDWGWDVASSVTTENGITPYAGSRMLKFIGTHPTSNPSVSPWCDVPQFVDLSPYAAQIAQGIVSVTATARFNRVAGNASTDTRFDVIIETHSGTVPGPVTGQNDVSLISDADPSTWELVTATSTVPIGTTHLLVGVYAYENVVNDTTGTEFAGHYADDVTLTVSIAPDIQVEEPVGMILVDGTSTVDFGTTPLGTPVTRFFRVTNTGGQALNVTGITLPSGYEHVGTFAPYSLAPSATHTFGVSLLANTAAGSFNGTLTLTSNDPDAESSFALALTGRAALVYPGAMAIKTTNPAATDGIYTLDPDGPGGADPFDAYCDMTTNGGGWTLLLKADGSQPTFQYSSALWTNTTTLNPGSPGLETSEFKSQGFSTVPFNAVMIGMRTGGTTRYLQPSFSPALNETSLRSMFLGAEKLSNSSRADWLGLTPPASPFDSHVAGVRGGVNITAPSSYPSVRLGVLLNNEPDNATPDAFVGLGSGPWLGQLITTSGAANYIHGYHAPGVGFLFVRDTTPGAMPSYAADATTNAATSITTSSAMLNGSVNPNGITTNAWFEWGPTTSYGSTTGSQAIGYGTIAVPLSGNLTGLMPGSTYHVRMVAQNGATTAYGADVTFSTLSTNADLASLTLSSGTLSPTFESGITSYSATVSNATASITATPTLADSNATVKVDNVTTTSGTASSAVNLSIGSNSIPILVTAEDGTTTKTYSVLVTRQSALETWRNQHFGSTANTGSGANTNDSDSDGVLNLTEFAFGTLPNNAGDGPSTIEVVDGVITRHGTQTVNIVKTGSSFSYNALFGRRKDWAAAGLTFTVQFSGDLSTWVSSTATPTVIADDGDVEAVTVRYPFFVNGKKAQFYRVVVGTQP